MNVDGWDVRVGVPVLLVDGTCAGACATRMPVYAVSLIRKSVCLLPSLLAYVRCSSRVLDGIHAKASGARCEWVVGTQRRACVLLVAMVGRCPSCQYRRERMGGVTWRGGGSGGTRNRIGW